MGTAASAMAIFALFMLPASALAQSEPVALPEVNVIAPSPLGGYVDRDKVPGTVQTLTAPDFTRTESPNITDTLFQRISGVSVSDPNGNRRRAVAQLSRFLCVARPKAPRRESPCI